MTQTYSIRWHGDPPEIDALRNLVLLRSYLARHTRQQLNSLKQKQLNFGLGCGYPRCCVMWFIKLEHKFQVLPGQVSDMAGSKSKTDYVQCPRCGKYNVLAVKKVIASLNTQFNNLLAGAH